MFFMTIRRATVVMKNVRLLVARHQILPSLCPVTCVFPAVFSEEVTGNFETISTRI